MSDFKWTLSRPGIQLEFETGSIKEAVGLLESEGTQISEIFGLTMGHAAPAETSTAPVATAEEPTKRKPRTPKVDAVAPAPLPVPTAAPVAPVPTETAAPTLLPPNALNGPDLTPSPDGGIPPFLQRPAPPLAPPAPTPPPVGVWGPKVVKKLDEHRVGKEDGGQALADWLANAGLTIKGANYDDACRAVLMIADQKIVESGILTPLGLAAAA